MRGARRCVQRHDARSCGGAMCARPVSRNRVVAMREAAGCAGSRSASMRCAAKCACACDRRREIERWRDVRSGRLRGIAERGDAMCVTGVDAMRGDRLCGICGAMARVRSDGDACSDTMRGEMRVCARPAARNRAVAMREAAGCAGSRSAATGCAEYAERWRVCGATAMLCGRGRGGDVRLALGVRMRIYVRKSSR